MKREREKIQILERSKRRRLFSAFEKEGEMHLLLVSTNSQQELSLVVQEVKLLRLSLQREQWGG